jgi:transporter, major facilitator family
MKKNLYVMYALALLQGMVFYGPIATLYRQAQGVTVFEITVIESISLALGILLEIPWGMIADRIGYRKTMIFCSALYFMSKIIFWQATGFGGFLAERIMLSVVLAGYSGVDSSLIYLSCEGTDSQKAFGLYSSMGMAGLLIAAAVFSIFVGDNYWLAGLLTVISYGFAMVLSFGLTEVRQTASEETAAEPFRESFRQIFSNRKLLLFLVGVALLSETHQTITVFLNQLQYERCGLNESIIGLVYIVVTLLGLLGAYSAAFTRRVGVHRSFALFCVLAAIPCLVLGSTSLALPSVISVLILRLSNTLFQPLLADLQNRQITSRNRATALSVCGMLVNGIAIGTNLVFGALSDWNLSAAFYFGSVICTVGLLLFWLWLKTGYGVLSQDTMRS